MPFTRHIVGAALVALAISLAACGPQEQHGGHVGHFLGMRHGLGLGMRAVRLGAREMRPKGFRRACEADVARLCPNARSRRDERECLEGKQSSLSGECREAFERRREPVR